MKTMVHFWHCREILGGNYAESFNAFEFYINLFLITIEHFCMFYLISVNVFCSEGNSGRVLLYHLVPQVYILSAGKPEPKHGQI